MATDCPGCGTHWPRTFDLAEHRARFCRARRHPLLFKLPTCFRHFLKGNRWWCRSCHREVERQFREVCHALWELQGAGDRIVR